jgi:thiol:disulfide interchange protein DsbD
MPFRIVLHLLRVGLLGMLLAGGANAQDLLGRAERPAPALVSTAGEFLPVEQAYPLQVAIRDGQLLMRWDITSGYYLYRQRMGLRLAGEAQAIAVDWPEGEAHEDAYLGQSQVYRGTLEVTVPLPASEPHQIELKSQGCADAGLCYPPRTQRFAIDPASGTVEELLAPPPGTLQAAPAAAQGASAPSPAPTASLAFMLLLAALGGLILNLMPCVFPVLSLKVLSVAQKGGKAAAGQRLAHGIAYSAGVVLSFVAVAALLLALRAAGAAIGWGFHLQSPPFVAGLAYLFLGMGLGLSGLVNFGAGMMGAGEALASRGGYAGSFFTGVLATVVASPCSAPFMGTALGYALTQSPVPALLVFAALGTGMAAPFLLLTASPRLLERLPHPGPWMEGFKQFLAFPLYAAAVWLLWVLGKQAGVDGMATVLGGGVLLALGLWTRERAPRHRHPLAFRGAGATAVVLALSLLASPLLEPRPHAQAAGGEGWEPYSRERLAELRRAQRAVFVNVTADWCITCLANEKVALDTETVRTAFRNTGVTYLKGDWTNSDPELTRLLTEHGRSGVPLYLYYPPGTAASPVILPQLLTPAVVLEALGAG